MSKIENEAGIIRANAMRFCLLLYVIVEKGQVDDVEHEDDDGEDVQVVAEQGNKEVEPDLPTLQEPQD